MLKIAAGPTINTILLLKIQITQGLYWLWWERIGKMSFCWQLLGSYRLTLTPEERKVPLWTLGAGERAPWAADCFVEGLPVKWFKQDYAMIRHGGDKFTGAGSLWRQPSLTKTSRPEWREATDLCQGHTESANILSIVLPAYCIKIFFNPWIGESATTPTSTSSSTIKHHLHIAHRLWCQTKLRWAFVEEVWVWLKEGETLGKKKKKKEQQRWTWNTALMWGKEYTHTHTALMMKDSTAPADTEIYCILECTFSIHLWVPIFSLIRHPLRLTGREWLELLRWELNPNSKGEQLTCRYEYLQSRYRLPRWQAGNISKTQQGRCANSQPAA